MADEQRRDLRLLIGLLIVALAIFAAVIVFAMFFVGDFGATMASGMGLRTAAIWGFFVTVALFVLFALVSGDSLIGEIQFMLGAFFTFFAVLTLLIAWVF